MHNLDKRAQLLALAIVGVLIGGVGTWYVVGKMNQPFDPAIPPEGLVVNPKGVDLGDPENAVKDFRRIYSAMDAYRRQTNRLPSLGELLDFSKPLAGVQLTKDDFNVPDAHLADGYVEGNQNLSTFMFAYRMPRPNGAPKPAFPAPGERDVWLVATDYTRNNQVLRRDRTADFDFKGVYVVLWSDGQIDKIDAGDARFAMKGPSGNLVFAGEAGAPKDTRSLKDIYSVGGNIRLKKNGKELPN